MFHENKSSGKGESAVNEPQPLISQQSMLTDQGCCKCTHLRKSFRSESKRQSSWDQAPFSPLLTEPSPTFSYQADKLGSPCAVREHLSHLQ